MLLHLLLLILTILFIIWLLVIFLLRLIIGLFILILMPRKLLTFSTNVMFSTKDVEFETTIGLVLQSLTLTSVLYEGFPVISRHMSSLVEDIDEATIQCPGHPWLYIQIPSTLPSGMWTFRPLERSFTNLLTHSFPSHSKLLWTPTVILLANLEAAFARSAHVCLFYPITHEAGHTPSGGAWDPKWGFDSYFFI